MRTAVRALARSPFAGVLITLIAMMGYWSGNRLRLGFEAVWPTAAVSVFGALLVTALLRMLCGSWSRAGIAAAMAAFYFFYIPALFSPLKLPFIAEAALHAGAIAGFFLLYRALPADSAKLSTIQGRVNLLCGLVFALNALPLAFQQFQLEQQRSKARGSLGDLEGRASADSPDVWHILLDRYAATDTLKTRYGFDNQPFVDALRKRGFVVQDQAFSNYQRTSHSVASTMNGSLLDPIGAHMQNQPADWVPIYRIMRDGSALKLFNEMGYRTIFAGSWWEPTRVSAEADESIVIRAMPQLARLVISQSAVGFWTQGINAPYLDGRGDQCFRANEKFRQLRALAQDPDRKQIFAHFLVPHPPFVLNADGSCRSLERATKSSRNENYLAQIRFANRELVRLVDSILAGPRPAMIVIHSDEGPWPSPYVGNEHGLGTDPVPVPWTRLDKEQLREKMGILMAVRDPSGRAPKTMPVSPVQIYPAILKDHFGSRRPVPSSRHYVFRSDEALYHFDEIGAKLQAPR
jgi:hypothetical protein